MNTMHYLHLLYLFHLLSLSSPFLTRNSSRSRCHRRTHATMMRLVGIIFVAILVAVATATTSTPGTSNVVYRGAWNASGVYYTGDLVTHESTHGTSSYVCCTVKPEETCGHLHDQQFWIPQPAPGQPGGHITNDGSRIVSYSFDTPGHRTIVLDEPERIAVIFFSVTGAGGGGGQGGNDGNDDNDFPSEEDENSPLKRNVALALGGAGGGAGFTVARAIALPPGATRIDVEVGLGGDAGGTLLSSPQGGDGHDSVLTFVIDHAIDPHTRPVIVRAYGGGGGQSPLDSSSSSAFALGGGSASAHGRAVGPVGGPASDTPATLAHSGPGQSPADFTASTCGSIGDAPADSPNWHFVNIMGGAGGCTTSTGAHAGSREGRRIHHGGATCSALRQQGRSVCGGGGGSSAEWVGGNGGDAESGHPTGHDGRYGSGGGGGAGSILVDGSGVKHRGGRGGDGYVSVTIYYAST